MVLFPGIVEILAWWKVSDFSFEEGIEEGQGEREMRLSKVYSESRVLKQLGEFEAIK